MRNLLGHFFHINFLKLKRMLMCHLKNCIIKIVELFEHFIQYFAMVSFRIEFSIRNKYASHSLSDELKSLCELLIFIKFIDVVLKVYLCFVFLLFYLIKNIVDILICPIFYLSCNVDICYWWPRMKKIVQKIFKVFDSKKWLQFWSNQLERNASLEFVTSTL